jgi:hypothetical protein
MECNDPVIGKDVSRAKAVIIAALNFAFAATIGAAPIENAVEAPGPSGPLRGTMLSPSSKGGAVVLIIPGVCSTRMCKDS